MIMLILLIKYFSFPSTSYFNKLYSFSLTFSQSYLVPAIHTLLIPHMQMALPNLKYFLKELMIIDVEISLYTSSVVEKLQPNDYTVPATVFFSIYLIIYAKKKSHYFYILIDSSTELANYFIVNYFCPSCFTNWLRSFSAF
jgi:hypothetical protein